MKRSAIKECFRDTRGKLFFILSTVMLIAGLIGTKVIPNEFKFKSVITMGCFILMILFSTLFSQLIQLYQNDIDREEAQNNKQTRKKKTKK